jgi:hypothetical protein
VLEQVSFIILFLWVDNNKKGVVGVGHGPSTQDFFFFFEKNIYIFLGSAREAK